MLIPVGRQSGAMRCKTQSLPRRIEGGEGARSDEAIRPTRIIGTHCPVASSLPFDRG
jgi:hypothetical protein